MKKLYEFYVATDNTFHCEVLPVVYENAKYVYYKRHGMDTLSCAEYRYINERVDLQTLSKYHSHQVVKSCTEEDMQFIKEHRFDPKRANIKKNLRAYRNSLDCLERDRVRYTRYIEDLEKQLAELGDKNDSKGIEGKA